MIRGPESHPASASSRESTGEHLAAAPGDAPGAAPATRSLELQRAQKVCQSRRCYCSSVCSHTSIASSSNTYTA